MGLTTSLAIQPFDNKADSTVQSAIFGCKYAVNVNEIPAKTEVAQPGNLFTSP
jgi:ribosome recycling factor